MGNAAKLQNSILKNDVTTFYKLMSSISDKEIATALTSLYDQHRKKIQNEELTRDLFLTAFNYLYNKYLIDHPRTIEHQYTSRQAPLKRSLVNGVFSLVNDNGAFAH